MSLINDALKRAKAAQKKDDSSSGPPLEFRPVEPGQRPQRQLPWKMFIGLGALLLVGILLLKIFTQNGAPLKVEAKSPQQNPAANQISVGGASGTLTASKPPKIEAATQAVAAAVSPTPIEPPKPAAPRLQALLYHPAHPSAVINGKTVFPGDKVGELRIVAITRDSVRLVSSTQTNVLTFEQ